MSAASTPDPDARPAPRIPWRRNLAEFLSSKTAVVGLAVLLLILAAALAPWIAPQNPYDLLQIDVLDAPDAGQHERLDTFHYWLGTDGQGRDLLSGILRPAHQPGGGRRR